MPQAPGVPYFSPFGDGGIRRMQSMEVAMSASDEACRQQSNQTTATIPHRPQSNKASSGQLARALTKSRPEGFAASAMAV